MHNEVECHIKSPTADSIHLDTVLQLTNVAVDMFVYNKIPSRSCVFLSM